LEALQTCIAAERNAALLGSIQQVLVEAEDNGNWRGRTRTDKLTFFPTRAGEDLNGKLIDVQILAASPWSLQGARRQDSREVR
jgi:tRNA-2-methylthio-N6-dimethylallyladenosine synthase